MSYYLLYISPKERLEGLPWPIDLSARGISLLHARNVREATYYCRAYSLIMMLMEIGAVDEALRADLETLVGGLPEGRQAPLVGVFDGVPTEEERATLAGAGLDDLILKSEPERFISGRLELMTLLSGLRKFEQARMDVAQLASTTRRHLHDLSQPLSAVQGRLQLLSARCAEDDPNSQTFKDLVRLIFDVTRQVMEIQQVHRQF